MVKGSHVTIDSVKLTTGGMEFPKVVDRPELVGGEHLLQSVQRRRLRPGASLFVEAECAAILFIEIPVVRRHVIVWAVHFHAGRAADGADDGAAAFECWPRRVNHGQQ